MTSVKLRQHEPRVTAATLRPASRRRLSEEVAAVIADAIVRGELLPGAHLVELDLAKSLEVSKSPIREALRELAAQGLVTIEPRRGARVLSLTARDLHEIGEFRTALETLAATNGMRTLDPDWLEELKASVSAMSRARTNAELNERHLAFHRLLVSRCDNRRVLEAIDSMSAQMRSFLAIVERLYGGNEEVASDHLALVAAVASRDPERIRITVEEHVLSSTERLEEIWRTKAAET